MCVLLPTAALLSFAGGAGLPEPAPAQAWIDLTPPQDRHLLADEQHTLLAAGCQRN
ncbi:hypothetical protein [Pseudomonas protegens]|uniref:hypothetical protein n=1 Tax=Pseudomonas protegens TaxID=380021 RepID=UPI002767DF48|nr:hypothetical protein [Pseudomonas protegens]MDP9515786.1 hypothetical protein [Pseudomonas protegens]